MNDDLCELKRLIDYVQTAYTNATDEWLDSVEDKINLRKCLVTDIDGPIYESIMGYVRFLNGKSAAITLPLSLACSRPVTSRVKAPNSIESKIQNYKTERHEWGRVPVNKCVNDLFGVRLILEAALTFEEIHAFVETTYQGKYKCIDSSKAEYKAVHLYFKENNQSFPWELQIWNRCDADSNFAFHKRYKQEYTTWEKERQGGGINDG